MDRDKEIGSARLLRTRLKTFNAAIKIDWPYKQATCRKGRSQPDGQHPVEIELLAATCADRARSRQGVTDIKRHLGGKHPGTSETG